MEVGKDYIGVGCGAIIVNDKQEVLLVKRSMNSRTEPGTWSRPGGEVEFGETIEDAVQRETLEEVGVRISIERLLHIGENISSKKHWLAIGYLARYVSGIATNLEPHKHDEVRWCSLQNLPQPLNKYTKKSIQIYLNE